MLRLWPIAKYASLLQVILLLTSLHVHASKPGMDLPAREPPKTAQGVIELKKGNNSYLIPEYQLRNRESNMQTVSNHAATLDADRARAEQMVLMIQDQELGKALKKVTDSGKKTLEENPGIKAPIYIIAGAAGFWAGRTWDVLKQESLRLSAKFEARNKRSEFSMSSPLLNGKLRFDSNVGNEFILNRQFNKIRTETSVYYKFQDQVITTEIRYKVAPNIDMTFGASKLDQSTKLEYRFNF